MSVGVSAVFGGAVGVWADLVGSGFLACFMVWLAFGIARRVLPDLLDKALSDELQIHINRALVAHFEWYDALGRVRSRRAGSRYIVEIELGFDPALPLGEVVRRLEHMRLELERDLPGRPTSSLIPTAAA
jgi:ferrous-iron efflux pump FieF